ncbi:Retrovirus-related Pol polyprotein from transposon RE1 [Vitis vinifera]|uniref:Retrovirus-related Pol polyprotein from transposon RE1 n=1 Tax=Vitis vinifera TaxID=29760 RepID=A0A438FIP9_VITVI|nr:Retrovirus-related Pol polyprotein from transposon RE1 [Vitis vinifera]
MKKEQSNCWVNPVWCDRRYLADQQESNCPGSAVTNRDQVQQTEITSILFMMSSTQSSGLQAGTLPSSTGATQTMQMLNHALPIKLDRNNYILWRTQMENVVFANGFEDHIEGLKICPPQKTSSGETNPDFVMWRRFDRMILSWIYSSLTPEIMGQIVGYQSSHAAWFALERIFSASSRARVMQLRLEFQTTRKGSLTMMEYILKLKSLADNLAAIGEPVTDRDQILQLLGGLGADYNSIVASLTAREDEMSLHSVHSILLTHEQRLSFQNSVAEDNVISANLATPQYQHFNNKRSSGQNRQSGFNTRRGTNGGRSQSSQHRPQCQLCGKFGHTVVRCYHRFDINFQGYNPNMDTVQTNKPNAKNQVQAMMASPSTISDEAWFFDTGATHHLSQSIDPLSDVQPYMGNDKVIVGNGKHLRILHTGTTFFPSSSKTFQLRQVLHVPDIATNLISVSQFCADNNTFFEFHPRFFFVKDQVTKKILLQGSLEHGLYRFPARFVPSPAAFVSSSYDRSSNLSLTTTTTLWHSRLGHPADNILKHILTSCNISHQCHKNNVCCACQFAKSHKLPFNVSVSRASHPLALLHADLWGPASIPSTTGARYFILFVDDFSRFSWIYPLHSKDQALSVFIKFKSLVENQFNSRIQCLRSDNGGEFKAFSSYLATHGIKSQFSCPYTPEQNGRAERKLRHIIETGLALLATASLPFKFWLYAFHTAIFLINRLPTKSTPDQSSSVVTIPTPAFLPCSSPPVSSLRSHTTPSTSSPPLTNMPSSTISLPDLIQVPFADISTSEPHPTNQHPMVTRAKNGISKKKVYFSSHISEPTTFTQAVKDSNWVLAMEKEFSALQRNNTWHLVPPPSNGNIIGCKWVYKLKYKPDGTVDRYKGPNAFLHGDLEEHVFMQQPPGFINSQYPSHVCKLNKALYGLKQAPRAWYNKLSTSLLGWGFQASRADSSMFIHHSTHDVLILLIYVDDVLVTGSKVVRSGTMFHLSQHKYTQDLLSRTAMLDSKPATTPGLLGQTLSHLDGEPFSDATLYRSTVGALQYLTLTRPDISFAVNKACQFMATPTTTHWLAVKRILRYLKGTLSYGIQMQQSTSLDIHGYTDADWASCPDDRRSTGGYGIFLGPNLVSWSSNKQKVVSRSSAESEYRALASATSEMIWIQYVLQELCLSSSSPPLLWCDNKSAAHLAANPVFHARTKHIEMDLHFIRDHVLRKQLVIQYLPSAEQVADIFTKHISSSQFLSFRTKLSVVPSPVSLRGDDRRYLADQQESNCPGSAATNRDQVQQTEVSCNKQKPVKNVLKKEGQDTLNLSWRSGLSRSRRDSCGAVFQKDKRANLGSSLETKLNLHIELSAYHDLMVYSRREKLVGNHLLGKKWVMECKQGQRQCSPTKTEKET